MHTWCSTQSCSHTFTKYMNNFALLMTFAINWQCLLLEFKYLFDQYPFMKGEESLLNLRRRGQSNPNGHCFFSLLISEYFRFMGNTSKFLEKHKKTNKTAMEHKDIKRCCFEETSEIMLIINHDKKCPYISWNLSNGNML